MQVEDTSSPVALIEAEIAAEQAENASQETKARKGLESKAIHATLWTVVNYGFSQVLRVVSSMVLTRLLMPEYFGLMTLVSTLIIGVSMLSDIGLNTSVTQSSRGDDPAFLNTAWTMQVLRGIGIFGVLLVLAWPMSLFYREPRLTWLMIALGAEIVVDSFKSTNLLSMARHMGVRRVFALEASAQVFGLLVTIACAWTWRSVWSLVIGVVGTTIYRVSMSHYKRMLPGIRNSFRWDKESLHDLVSFGKWIVLSTAFYFFASQADRLLMGKLTTFAMLGVYGVAYSVSDVPRQVINAFTNRVGFPFITKMVHLPIAEFRKVFLQYRLKVLLAGAALLCLVVHLGGFAVSKMYDHRYHDASWMVPILALGLWHTLMYSTTYPALLSLGKSKYGAIGNGYYMVAIATAIYFGFRFFGIWGAVIAVAAGDFPLYVVYTVGASREGVSTWRQDAQATAVFVVLISVGFAIRKAMGLGLLF